MKKLILIFWLISEAAFGQQIYQPNEVETQAEPLGGSSMLNHFISSNLQLPILAASKGIKGRVFVKGTIEPDGSMTGLQIIRGINDGCNTEALRLMTLYKAWKPASIKGTPVRQWLVYPVSIQVDPIARYDSTMSAYVYYFDKNKVPVEATETAKFRDVMPVDQHGYLNGDALYQQLKGDKWKTINTVAVQKTEEWHKIAGKGKLDSIPVTRIKVPNTEINRPFQELVLKQDGKLLSYTDYSSAGTPTVVKRYHQNGVLKQLDQHADGLITRINWFGSGHMQYVMQFFDAPGKYDGIVVKGAWDEYGNSLITDGAGRCRLAAGSQQGKEIWEEGKIFNGHKTGNWVGMLADSTLLYEEFYENGELKKGTAFNNGKNVEYTEGMQQPQFEGGTGNMYQFLGTNIMYPISASKSRIMGKVMLAFTVCEDGSLCDYEVEKGVEKSLDNEALRVVKKMSGKWQPGKLRGRNVRVKYRLPVNFQLQ